MTKEQIKSIVSCLQEHAQTIGSSEELKQFFESNFEFDGYYSVDESYRDFFVSEFYLNNEVSKCIARNEKTFIDTLRQCVGNFFWNNHKNEIEPRREYTPEEEINFVFKDLDNVDYSKFGKMQGIIEYRIKEMKKCYIAEAYLSVIILAGSVLEALLVSLYNSSVDLFKDSLNCVCTIVCRNNMDKKLEDSVLQIKKLKNQVTNNAYSFTPEDFDFCKKQKNDLKKEQFQILITLSYYIGILKNKYSFDKANELREYRNYIHPAKQNDNYNTFTADDIKAKSFISNLAVALKDISEWKPKEKN
jgi:hypothetical protein